MNDLFRNAVISIQLGVEDYKWGGDHREISAVRNFYAGILLLAKEVLVRKCPPEIGMTVLANRFKPVPSATGGVEFVADGNQTIDFGTIGARFRDFGISIDDSALKDLNRIRNDLEHKFSNQSAATVTEMIAKAFPIVLQLFAHLGEDPAKHLGDAWSYLLENRTIYETELEACRASYRHVKFYSEVVRRHGLVCGICSSELIGQLDVSNEIQQKMELRCRSCRETHYVSDNVFSIVETVKQAMSHEAKVRSNEGRTGPVDQCEACDYLAYIDTESQCAACGHVGKQTLHV